MSSRIRHLLCSNLIGQNVTIMVQINIHTKILLCTIQCLTLRCSTITPCRLVYNAAQHLPSSLFTVCGNLGSVSCSEKQYFFRVASSPGPSSFSMWDEARVGCYFHEGRIPCVTQNRYAHAMVLCLPKSNKRILISSCVTITDQCMP